ncbi:tetratricopeptide repeat protein [Albibacterium profundi]|uniref:Tetratricopeptide repeat protein n=1 Tax=Albibacterium profundi TaxID=3134906 RepID=A0ABV5CDR1_9SPHI
MKKAINIGLALSFVASGAFAQSLDDAKAAIKQEQYAKAKGILQNLVKNDSKEGDNYYYLGSIYLTSGYPDSAKMVFDQGIAADSKNQINKVGIGALQFLDGNASAAETTFKEVEDDIKRRDYEELLEIGKSYLRGENPDYNKAIEYLNKAKEKEDEDAAIFLQLGNAYFGLGDNSNAYVNYRDATSLDNSLINAQVQMAVISKEAYAFPEASSSLKEIASQHPNFAPTYRELAETYYLWSRRSTTVEDYDAKLQEALEHYKKYMDLTDYSLDSRMRYADFLILAKDYETLEVQANEMAKIDKMNPRILRYLGYAAYENGNYQESKRGIEEFMAKVEPERLIPRDYMFLGLADLRLATDTTLATPDEALMSEAVANLEKSVKADSLIAEDLNEIGMEIFKAGQYGAAAKVFEVATMNSESKNYVVDLFYLGYANYFDYVTRINDEIKPDKALLEKADAAFAKVTEEVPTTEAAYLYRAKATRLLDDAETPEGLFVPHYEKYIEVVTEKGDDAVNQNKQSLIEAYNVNGAFYSMNDEYEKARENFRSTLELDPANEYAAQALENLQPAQQPAQ